MKTKIMSPFLLVLSVWMIHPSFVWGDPEDLSEQFYSENYEAARQLVASGATRDLSPEIQLYNLALIDAKQGRAALALGRLRQSLYLSPSFRQAWRAQEWVAAEASFKDVRPRTSFEKLRGWFWLRVPLGLYPALLLVTFLLGGWRFFSWLEIYRQNQAQEIETKTPWSALFLLILSLAFATLWGLQSWDRHFNERGTYIGSSGLKAGPSEDAPEVAPLSPGEEVLVEREHRDWLLVHRPGGFSGWVLSEDLYVTSQSFRQEDL